MLKLLSIIFLITTMLGVAGLLYGIFSDVGLAIISAVVIILGLFGWYVIRGLDSGLKEEAKHQNPES